MIVFSLVFFGTVVSASAQQLLQLGPFGKPVMVLDEGSNWSIPIQVYSDSNVVYYIPDITTSGWVSWHVQQFRQTGEYTVPLIAWYKTDSDCLTRLTVNQRSDPKYLGMCKLIRYEQKLVSIDTRNNIITELQSILMESDARLNPMNVNFAEHYSKPFNEVPKRIATTVTRINAIVVPEMREYKGITIQDALRMDRETVARMAAASGNGESNENSTAPQRIQSLPRSGPESSTEGNFGSRFPWYLDHIKRKVSQDWNGQEVDPRTSCPFQFASIRFTVRQDGSLTDIRIDHPSGSPTLDRSCLLAAQRVDTFGPLPSEWEKSTLDVSYDCECAGSTTPLDSGETGNANGIYRVGGGVSAPVVLNNVEAEITDEARRNKLQGTVLITIIVAPDGIPQHIQVVRSAVVPFVRTVFGGS
jgi:TonB family protein